MKICVECGLDKSYKEFYKRKASSDGFEIRCKPCHKVKHKKSILSSSKKYKANHRTLISTYNKEYKKEHRKEIAIKMREWRKDNLSNRNAYKAKQRASKRRAVPLWVDEEAIKLLYKCSRELTELTGILFHVDHIIPLVNEKVCGLHTIENLRIIPAIENLRKHNKLVEDIV